VSGLARNVLRKRVDTRRWGWQEHIVADQQAEQSRAAERAARSQQTSARPKPSAETQRGSAAESVERVRQARKLSDRSREQGLER
jgi:hypothetical protein